MAIEETKDHEALGDLLKQVQENKQAIANDEGLKQSLAEELGTKGKHAIENELIAEKRKFLDKHKIKEG